jgi:hypothetical protein
MVIFPTYSYFEIMVLHLGFFILNTLCLLSHAVFHKRLLYWINI